MFGSTARLVVSVAALGVTAMALPAGAAAPAYSPGDVVTVDGASVIAPAPGNSVAISVDRVAAPSTTLVVSTDASGTVTVSDSRLVVPPADEAAPNKCDDPDYMLMYGTAWEAPYDWRFKKSSTPDELTPKKAKKALKAAVKNITAADNDCGLPDNVSATANYEGFTDSSSDVNPMPSCDFSPNRLNVTEFGPIEAAGVLAASCTYGTPDELLAASVLINTDFEWWTGGSCSDAYSVKAVGTHEYGHVFGLDDVGEAAHGNLTMSADINDPCSHFEANLGQGDVLALEVLY